MTYVKATPPGLPDYPAWEAAGLRWLAAAPDGARTVGVVRADPREGLVLERLTPTGASPEAAEEFGRRLAATHDAGAEAWGAPPDDWTGDGWLGPSHDLLPLSLRPSTTWGEFYAAQRIQALVRVGRDRGTYSDSDAGVFDCVARRLATGEFDTEDRPARLHGDLWSGNVVWTDTGAVLIDPAAHGGHRETDLAMLALFGAPHLPTILAAYDEAHPLAPGWHERVELHQLHPLMLHAVVFGGGYVGQSRSAARRYA